MYTLMNNRKQSPSEAGMTLLELLVVMAIVSSLMVLSTAAAQRYARHQQLATAVNAVESQLRQVQQRAVAVSHPSVFGAWFSQEDDSTVVVESDWGPIEYIPNDPLTAVDETGCVPRGERDFDTGQFDSGEIEIRDLVVEPFAPANPLHAACYPAVPQAEGFVFFFARGDATPLGVTLFHPRLERTGQVRITPLTGRVDSCVGNEC